MINITHTQLLDLVENNQLKAGFTYCIVDYKTTQLVGGEYVHLPYKGRYFVEPLITLAISTNQLSEFKSTKFPNDQISYNLLENRITKRVCGTFNVSANYDFRGVLFRRMLNKQTSEYSLLSEVDVRDYFGNKISPKVPLVERWVPTFEMDDTRTLIMAKDVQVEGYNVVFLGGAYNSVVVGDDTTFVKSVQKLVASQLRNSIFGGVVTNTRLIGDVENCYFVGSVTNLNVQVASMKGCLFGRDTKFVSISSAHLESQQFSLDKNLVGYSKETLLGNYSTMRNRLPVDANIPSKFSHVGVFECDNLPNCVNTTNLVSTTALIQTPLGIFSITRGDENCQPINVLKTSHYEDFQLVAYHKLLVKFPEAEPTFTPSFIYRGFSTVWVFMQNQAMVHFIGKKEKLLFNWRSTGYLQKNAIRDLDVDLFNGKIEQVEVERYIRLKYII